MGRWTDLATWRGPTVNQGPSMAEQRGLVVHIAQGSFEGTIAWQRNPDANVSSHFVVARDGRIAQMVDTDVAAWTQRDGNGRWLSVENEGFVPQALSPAQVEANARILARAHQAYGVSLQLATSPTGRGLGHHSMGAENGFNWGHSACPGEPIKAQKPAILARAVAITQGLSTQEDDMVVLFTYGGQRWRGNLIHREPISPADETALRFIAGKTGAQVHDWGSGAVANPDAFGVHRQTAAVDAAALAAELAPLLPSAPSAEAIADAVADEQAGRLAE